MTPKDEKTKPTRGLGDFLCFAVYSANLAFGRAYKPILDQVGLTYPQYITIVALWDEDHQTVGSLGEKLGWTSTIMSAGLEAMLPSYSEPALIRLSRRSATPFRILRNSSGFSPDAFTRLVVDIFSRSRRPASVRLTTTWRSSAAARSRRT